MRTLALSITLAASAALVMPGSVAEFRSDVPSPASPVVQLAAQGQQAPTLTPQVSGTVNRLQAVSPVSPLVVWASGVGGTYAVTTDGGATWRTGVVPGAEALQFRDVEGVSEKVAYLMSSGVGTDSRIFKTEDGGATWTLRFQNEDPNGFYDCFAFWSQKHGIAMADAVGGRFPVIRTLDGVTWQDIGDSLPAAQDGEAAFAASGTCVTAQGGKHAWIITGAAPRARILATIDGGETWAAYDTPIVQGTPSSGGFSVDFRDPFHGILGGGELATPAAFSDTVARTTDGGQTWQLGGHTPFPGAIYGLTYVRGRQTTVVATGPAGAAWSPDEGLTWFSLAGLEGYWAVAFASPQAGWLVGTQGRIVKVSF
jgi:photosystem II stability/assembly factor-like uncharacterized protein